MPHDFVRHFFNYKKYVQRIRKVYSKREFYVYTGR
ncbi:hypothetical protein C8C85_3730 [Flavobacterium sp. 103]|nr:hypothetical protein C8C85_3730 [Flavobacterium sp. 103]